jgi:hypothetical protein
MIEILILQKCEHKNIVKYFGSWKKGEELFVRWVGVWGWGVGVGGSGVAGWEKSAHLSLGSDLTFFIRLQWSSVTAARPTISTRVRPPSLSLSLSLPFFSFYCSNH